MRSLVTLTLSAVLLAAGLSTSAGPARASTGGARDGAQHPDVAFIAGYADGTLFRCSAALVSPTVLLTAAHCAEGTDGRILVTFDPTISEQPPAPVPSAAERSAGYTRDELAQAGYLSGTALAHPAYSGSTDFASWNDVGVVLLDEPVTGVDPAPVAEVGTLDAYAQPRLNRTLFTAVGYGTEVRKPDSGPQQPQPMSYPLVRRYVEMPGQKLTPQLLQLNGNDKDVRGTGGTCFGDSGGPVLLDGEVVAVTSYVLTDNCRYLGGFQRVDIAGVQDWLATFGV